MTKELKPQMLQGPYVVSALFCEKVLREADGVNSAIRIIDRITATFSGSENADEMPPIPVNLNFFLSIKSGSARGPVEVQLTLTGPDGIERPEPLVSREFHFESGTRGQNVIANLNLEITEAGPYWMNVYVGGSVRTRTPLEIIVLRV